MRLIVLIIYYHFKYQLEGNNIITMDIKDIWRKLKYKLFLGPNLTTKPSVSWNAPKFVVLYQGRTLYIVDIVKSNI